MTHRRTISKLPTTAAVAATVASTTLCNLDYISLGDVAMQKSMRMPMDKVFFESFP